MTNTLTIGERVAWYRRRRGIPQVVLADVVGRTEDWLSKVENNRLPVDRLSVIKRLAEALDVSIGDLLCEPSLVEWTADSGRRTLPALRDALMDYRQLALVGQLSSEARVPSVADLRGRVTDLWSGYQDAKFGYVTHSLPAVLRDAHVGTQTYTGDDARRAHAQLALTYQVAATTLTKFGETDLAWIAADRGLVHAAQSENAVVSASLQRAVVHALLSNGRYAEAVALTEQATSSIAESVDLDTPTGQSVYGAVFLAGAMAASRLDEASATRTLLGAASRAADRLGRDANHLWTAFGPTNVAIHRVSTAVELGNVQVAVDLGPRVTTAALPVERRVRHAMEVARAFSAWNRSEDALATLLDAESQALEQVRYHFISRQLVLTWMRNLRGKPSYHLAGLAQRLRIA